MFDTNFILFFRHLPKRNCFRYFYGSHLVIELTRVHCRAVVFGLINHFIDQTSDVMYLPKKQYIQIDIQFASLLRPRIVRSQFCEPIDILRLLLFFFFSSVRFSCFVMTCIWMLDTKCMHKCMKNVPTLHFYGFHIRFESISGGNHFNKRWTGFVLRLRATESESSDLTWRRACSCDDDDLWWTHELMVLMYAGISSGM